MLSVTTTSDHRSETDRRWRNWGSTYAVTSSGVERPATSDDVAAVVSTARARGARVKAVGAGHSFSGIAVPDDVRLELSGLRGLVRIDEATRRVTLRGGTHLHEIPAILEPLGLAMANLGDVDRQTVAGAISTGTHGTGGDFGGISTQVVGVTIVTGTGEIREITAGDPDLAAVALGLGALGVITEVTLQCVDSFALHAQEYPTTADAAVDEFLGNVAAHDHHEFYWFPHTNRALAKTNTRLPAETPAAGPGSVRRYIDDELLSNGFFGALCAVGARVPAIVPAISQVSARALSARSYTDVSTKVFISSRTVRFREMEYAVPLDAVPEAIAQVRTMIERRGFRVSFPIEVRAAAADDLMLSTASGRAGGYIAAHRFHHDDAADSQAYFDAFEEIMVGHDGRPHWGKMHTRDAGYLRTVYPRFDEFLGVRDRFDPNRVFTNDYLRTILGD